MKINLKFFTKNQRVTVFVCILIAFVLIYFLTDKIFIAGTPRIKQEFISSITSLPDTIASIQNNISNKIRYLTSNQEIKKDYEYLERVKNSRLKAKYLPVAKGVYAGQADGVMHYKVTKQARLYEEKVTIAGKTYTFIKFCTPKTDTNLHPECK